MFIELTDHLICPADHPEHYLVLLPDLMEGRRVVTGTLGCPACGRITRVNDGVVEFDPAEPSPGRTGLTALAAEAFLGLSGPGGFVALAGGATALAAPLGERLAGVGLVLVNPPAGTPDSAAASVVRAARLPLKTGSLRGVVLGAELGSPAWGGEALRAVLPGLRIVGEAGEPPGAAVLLGRHDTCWIAAKASSRPPTEF